MAIKKSVSMLNKAIANQINHFSCRGKSKLIGSNSVRGMLFTTDIDAETDINNMQPKDIVKYLRKALTQMKDTYLLEFKAGLDKHGEKLRWSASDIKKGTLKGIKLEDAIMQKSTVKADLICRVGDVYEEISINFYIKIGDRSNFNKQTTAEIQRSLEEDINEYRTSNTLKALKRLYSALKLEKGKTDKLKKLEAFFNSSVGLENKVKNELNILLQILELEPWANIYRNLQVIKQQLASLFGVSGKKLIAIDYITKTTAKGEIESLIEYLTLKINKASIAFLQTL